MSPFEQYILRYEGNHSPFPLPLVHTTAVEALKGFVKSECVQTRHCSVFKEHLIYLFYGRPAYRSSRGLTPSGLIAYLPICFVFRLNCQVGSLRRVYPFDSGAAYQGFYHPHIAAEDARKYELPPMVETAMRIVATFFQTNAG